MYALDSGGRSYQLEVPDIHAPLVSNYPHDGCKCITTTLRLVLTAQCVASTYVEVDGRVRDPTQ